jgi:hypothetical protein
LSNSGNVRCDSAQIEILASGTDKLSSFSFGGTVGNEVDGSTTRGSEDCVGSSCLSGGLAGTVRRSSGGGDRVWTSVVFAGYS